METEPVKDFVVQCIERARGDDLCRARAAFKHFSPDKMEEEHGQSGRTRQQVLDGHIEHNRKCDVAITVVKRHL